MSKNPRDTHFVGFASLLLGELLSTEKTSYVDLEDDSLCDKWRALIAHYAYDLVKHTLLSVEHINLDRLDYDEHVERIPDLKELCDE